MLRSLLRVSLTAVPLMWVATPSAHSQSLNLPPDVEAAYPAAPLTHEMLVKSAEGCGFFISKPDDTTVRVVPSIVQILTDNWKHYRWSGVCLDGLALGRGEMEFADKEGKVVTRAALYALRGRNVGETTSHVGKIGDYTPYTGWSYSWKGMTYVRNVPTAVTPLQPPGPDRAMYSVSVFSPDRRKSVSWSLFGKSAWSEPKIVSNAMTDKFVRTGNYPDRLTDFPCTEQTCGAIWVQRAGPVLKAYSEFQARHEPEVAALKSSLEPVVKPLIEQRERAVIAAEKQRVHALAAERVAARQQAVIDANRERRPIPTPGLDALVKKALGGAQ